jgi:predicted GNAT family N-acyltransferase
LTRTRAVVRAIDAAATRPLRQRVLRPTQKIEELVYPGDDARETRHFGAFDDHGTLVGIASVYRDPKTGTNDAHAWRLRGMATEPHARRKGHGAALIDACIAHAIANGGTSLWCNARVSAKEFYAALGFVTEGDVFDVPHAGPHYVMSRSIGDRLDAKTGA